MYHTALFTVCSILYGPRGGHFDITVQAISILEALVILEDTNDPGLGYILASIVHYWMT